MGTMPNVDLPLPIDKYFAAKGGDVEETVACFTADATVWDNGEDRVLTGVAEIRDWLSGTIAGYKLTSTITAAEARGDEHVVGVVVSGDFPGSPYEFAYRFKLRGDKISELAIDPIGPVSP